MDNNSNDKKLSIKNWAVEDRPREKLLAKGIFSLSNTELIAILIGSGSRTKTAVELAQEVLYTVDNNLNQLGKLTVDQLIKIKGIGQAKAISIVAALELGRRRKLSEVLQRRQITGSYQAFEFFHSILGDLPHEEFWILLLDNSKRIIHKQKISQGAITRTVIDQRIIFKSAIEKQATSMILCHNHPSGNKFPSSEDEIITRYLVKSGKILDIQVLDHIIIAGDTYFSFADKRMIDNE